MRFIADLHIHSHYSRATSRDLNLESVYQWARIKGLQVIATGDFTHPGWMAELEEKLEPDGSGLFRLKHPPETPGIPGIRTSDDDVRFCLSVEISSIYKYGDKTRKNHNLVFAPDFGTAKKISARLAEIGNLKSDGRPILGLPSRDLLEIVLESSPEAHLIPAHVWTPWFSTLGSKGGYDSIDECFRDLSDHIFALETGLSSDPAMNWKLSSLDKYTLVSNSDAHSAQKLGREANLFDTERSYPGIFDALKTRQGFLGTYEFFPEEGKYHLDGHRKCNVSFTPEESLAHGNRCPVCGKPLTIGVLNRVESLADRAQAKKPEGAPGFSYIIPLPEILGQIMGAGPSSKSVTEAFARTISAFGNEFDLLQRVPLEDIRAKSGGILAEAIRRLRTEEVHPEGGYDGEYGTIAVFAPGELASAAGQTDLLGGVAPKVTRKRAEKTGESAVARKSADSDATDSDTAGAAPAKADTKSPAAGGLDDVGRGTRDVCGDGGQSELNAEQRAAVEAEGSVLVIAGPGSGKTHTLMEWIRFQTERRGISPEDILAITFTNKAADELRDRLEKTSGAAAKRVVTGTFHAVAYRFLQKLAPEAFRTIYDSRARLYAFRMLLAEANFTPARTVPENNAVNSVAEDAVAAEGGSVHDGAEVPSADRSVISENSSIVPGTDSFSGEGAVIPVTGATAPVESRAVAGSGGSASRGMPARVLSESEKRKRAAKLSALYESLCEQGGTSPESPGNEVPSGNATAEETTFFERYQRFLAENHAVDLSAILPEAIRRLSVAPPEFLAHFRCVAVDEFQDISPVQYEFVRLLGRDRHLFVIGDPDQSIYAFRGADIRLLDRIRKEFEPEEIFLKENYRTPPRILQAANALIAHNAGRVDRVARAMKTSETGVSLFAAKDAREEARYIAEQTLALVGGVDALSTQFHRSDYEYAFSDIAVLCRTHAAVTEILKSLRAKGIPVVVNDAASLWEEPPFSSVGAALEFLANPQDGMALAAVADAVAAMDGAAPDAHIRTGGLSRIREYLAGNLSLENFAPGDAWKEWVALYRKFSDLPGAAGMGEGASAEPSGEASPEASKMSASLETLMTALLDFFLGVRPLTEMEEGKKQTLLRLVKENAEPLSEFVRKQILSSGNGIGHLAGGVHLLTFHAAKGLEFPVVFLAAAEEGITPSAHAGTDIEEERRLFYVAMTRAKEELRISCAGTRILYGKERQMEPSRFLEELGEGGLECIRWRPAGSPEGPRVKQMELF